MDYINPKKIHYLPNTAGCFNSKDALRTLRLAREMGGWKLVKLEVLADKKTLYPNMLETIQSTKILVKEGFKVMVYCTDDPILAKKLEDSGASAIMPLASPIGSSMQCLSEWSEVLRFESQRRFVANALSNLLPMCLFIACLAFGSMRNKFVAANNSCRALLIGSVMMQRLRCCSNSHAHMDPRNSLHAQRSFGRFFSPALAQRA